MVKKSDFFLIAILTSFALFFVYLYFYINHTQQDMKNQIIKNKITHMTNVFSHIEKQILKTKGSQDLVIALKDKKTRDILETQLTQMLSKNIKYVYFLFLDNNGKFRFLLDGSCEDRARFYQKFDPLNKQIYQDVYKTASVKTMFQKDMENLSMTILYPVKQDGKVIGILSMDMTTGLQDDITRMIEPLKNFFVVLIVFIFLLISVAIVQLFRYFKTRKQLFNDPLTNVFNRNYLQEVAPSLNLSHYSLAMFDLDRFKVVNDTYGHKMGDIVLQECAMLFKNNIRDSDILIRYGGEEFILLINKRGENDNSFEVCNRILKKISKYIIRYDDNEVVMTLSIGLYQDLKNESNIIEAIKKADAMLYLAKQRGRNQIVKYSDNIANITTTNKKGVDDVKSALNEDRIVCYFQPIVDAKSLKILKYEALVRMLSKSKDIIYPNDFLPYIKHTNIHYKLTKKILEICFDKFSKNDKLVSINLSFLDLLNQDVVELIVERLTKDKSLASRITFEILESDEIEDIEIFTKKIQILHKLGSKIAIDDFGSGYSNFKAVLDVKADFLKIDGTLIKDMANDEKVFKVVKNIILFAKDSDMKTIAEFVATKEILDSLKKLDVDYLQGFYLAKPSADIIETVKI